MTGIIIGTSISNLDTLLDTFRAYFLVQDKNLDIDYGSGVRRFIATPKNVKIKRPGGLLFANFQIDFICTDPFGWDTSTTSLIADTGVTSGTYAPTCTFIGNAPMQRPTITLTYTAMTGNTGTQSVFIGNAATGQTIAISRVWASTDVIVIDCYNKTVTINGVPVAFSGAFPEFKPGAGGFSYIDQFSARTMNFSVIQTAAYI